MEGYRVLGSGDRFSAMAFVLYYVVVAAVFSGSVC